jgi:mediator of RNA polymerase II transcription subunit 13
VNGVNISDDFIIDKYFGKQAVSNAIDGGKGDETAQSQDIYSSELLRPTLFVLPSPAILVGYVYLSVLLAVFLQNNLVLIKMPL